MGDEKENSKVFYDFIKALKNKDMEKALSFFDEGAEWITPEGEFHDEEELGRYLKWFGDNIHTVSVSNIRLVSKGNIAACELFLEGNSEGENWQVTALSYCEVNNSRIIYLRTVYDRLSVARQVARDGLAGLAVSKIVERMEEGLH